MNTSFILALALSFSVGTQSNGGEGPQNGYAWPNVVGMKKSVDFPVAKNAIVELPVLGTQGRPLYVLECRGRGINIDRDFEYTGDFECRLKSLYTIDRYSTLLTEDPLQERSWESRGRFLSEELTAGCSEYPEYGRLRHFRLRGMTLTLELSQMSFEDLPRPGDQERAKLLSAFRLTVVVQPDPDALSTIAEEAPFAPPSPLTSEGNVVRGYRCDRILRRHINGLISEQYLKENQLEPPYPNIERAVREASLPGQNSEFQFADAPLPAAAQGFYLPIQDDRGQVAYEFECSSTEPINRWGIQCGLFAKGKQTNLLQDSTDPYSRMDRATILPEQLNANCANYPDWGAKRTFRLRGLSLELILKDPVPVRSHGNRGGEELKRVDMIVRVEPDPASTSPVAEAPRYAYWGFLGPSHGCSEPTLVPQRESSAPLSSLAAEPRVRLTAGGQESSSP